ncbi:MAG TPA: hypothetical protein ENH99_02775 [Candidatus Pacearchaeota archaeon]|nr:hypothetical protein [Candidatus Pacearchaeota archaeon]
MTLLDQIEKVLEEDERLINTKDSFQTWVFLTKVAREIGINIIVDFKTLKGKPSPESIIKERRDVLNSAKFRERFGHLRKEFVPEEGVTYGK